MTIEKIALVVAIITLFTNLISAIVAIHMICHDCKHYKQEIESKEDMNTA